ncbi:MAG: precorrin-3B C(17)-methyltransferase [Thermodesulfobacteriota bacterium]|nr:precorrin-3B C(17)-methyltransferase [Thermodesulfobacteriota bacterium]
MDRDKIAFWALSEAGLNLAVKCAKMIDTATVFVPASMVNSRADKELAGFDRFSRHLSSMFFEYDAHVFIMASGIVVRSIAGLIRNKATDPAVVVMDEAGNHVISLVSGHLGGANALCAELASRLGANAVITTATDVNSITAMDDIARRIGAVIENREKVKHVAKCMLNRAPVAMICDRELFESCCRESDVCPEYIENPNTDDLAGYSALCFITEKRYDVPADVLGRSLFIRPSNLVLGIGCNRHTSSEEISAAVDRALDDHHLSPLSIAGVASIDKKKDEPGLNDYARTICKAVHWFAAESLDRVEDPGMSPLSVYAKKYVNTKAVAEPAALLCAGPDAALIVPKQKIGNVTVAVAKKRSILPPKKTGKLFVVGIGPGGADYLTAHARRVIENSDVIAGYKAYINLVAPLIAGREIISTGMTRETERVDAAVTAAAKGKTVALICSGDAGIYGMAGLVHERMAAIDEIVDTEVSPGVSAATAAAALLGAPLVNDFITLSLSNLLTPTETVEKRIEMAAASDMVTAVYNPVSKKRTELIRRLQAAFLRHRPENTVVGIVTHALRSGQKIQMSILDNFLECEMSMNSILIIGNSDTILMNGRMVTRRGYERKWQGP